MILDNFGNLITVFDVFWASECFFILGPWARAREAAVAADREWGVWGGEAPPLCTSRGPPYRALPIGALPIGPY